MNAICSLAAAAVLTMLSVSQGSCGRIVGCIRRSQDRSPVMRTAVSAYTQGRALASASASDRDGRFVIDGLSAGRYAVCVAARDNSRPSVVAVEVPTEGDAEVDFVLGPSVEVDGDSWVQSYPVFYQSFRATGLGVTGLRLKAFGSGRRVTVQLLEGEGPSGKPVGPSRTTVSFGGEGEAAVYWSGGELPTVPGRVYTLKLSARPGERWTPGTAGRGDVYPLGRAYFGSEPRPHTDLGFALCEENDRLSISYAVPPGQRTVLARSVGQVFRARSRNVTYAAVHAAGAVPRSVFLRFSIHERGPDGRQIGPSKVTALSADSAVAWLPEEVPVSPGGTYYLHIESCDGASFYAFEEPDCHSGGSAFTNGNPMPDRDLAAWVCGDIDEAQARKLPAHPEASRTIPLSNHSFEDGTAGWTLTAEAGRAVGCSDGVAPAWGTRMFGWTNRKAGENTKTIIYQMVKLVKGKRYSFSGSVYTDHVGGRSSDQKIRLVVDPEGGKAFGTERMESSQWYATEGQWRRGSVEFTATSDTAAVGFELEQRWSLDKCSLYVDGAQLDELKGGAR